MAQKKSVINLIRSKSIQGVKINGVDVLKVYGGTFQQDYSTLTSDSAYFHQAQNTFDAFGHVVISQGDTLNIYSDKLNYNGNTKIAILTDNVRMVDKDATLTTNYLTYNTATKFGTYTGGGKLVNKDNTLTSKNGYYFANSRDSYFRYDVVLLSPDAITKTDTLRYNTGSKIAYFYGPTHIYGKKKDTVKTKANPRDNDTLYTENGLYNTVTEQAFFGKKNLYSQGAKTLKGDSMFYDRKKGYGRVVKNITFNDNEQKMTLKGDLGTYFKADERTIVTENAYGIIVTEEKDTSKKDSIPPKPITISGKKMKADTAKTKTPPAKAAATIDKSKQVAKPDNKANPPANTMPLKEIPKGKSDSIPDKNKKGKKPDLKNKFPDSLLKKDTARVKHDSVYMRADTIETRVLTYKEYKDIQEKIRLSHIVDTNKKAPSIVYKKPVKYIELSAPAFHPDTAALHRNLLTQIKPEILTAIARRDSAKVELLTKGGKKDKKAKANLPPKPTAQPPAPVTPGSLNKNANQPEAQQAEKKLTKQDSLKLAKKDSLARIKKGTDSVYATRKVNLKDTARIRILSAFHHVKLFKSDLQGKSDSAFYSTSDSVIRLYVHPIIWTQGSQLSGDTVDLQLKNKKFDNIELFPNAFVVNIEKGDSTHFNQSAGKKMRGFFNNDKLERLFIDGNAETIYFSRDSGKVSGIQRSLSSRIRINFKDSKLTDITFLAKPEHRYGPLDKFTEDDKILKGFLWKPKERPASKEEIIAPKNKEPAKKPTDKNKAPAGSKQPSNKAPDNKAARDTSDNKQPSEKLPEIKAGKDTSGVKLQKDTSAMKFKADTTLKFPAKKEQEVKKDSAATKPKSR
jgi:lipopolysaccharide export system protein LptA